jgi:starch synthase (maltosyl-transferring)
LENRQRAVIKGVKPEVEDGRFSIKRTIGQSVKVEADIFADGHDSLTAYLLYRHESRPEWTRVAMENKLNDSWQGSFQVDIVGRYVYTIVAWIDHFRSWQRDLTKRIESGQSDIEVNLLMGAQIIAGAGQNASGEMQQLMVNWSKTLQSDQIPLKDKLSIALDQEVLKVMAKYPNQKFATTYPKELGVVVEPVRALFSSWYEMFPRSCSPQPGLHGTFRDCESRLSYIAKMGFDVLYLPPVHPIGHTNRKGKNNSIVSGPQDVGTPWAIGSEVGGHTSIHPQLGDLEDFQRFRLKAREFGLEVAMDLAFQCSPDHPYVEEHPKWFKHRPDGSIQFAENPPKKYQDIYPLDFESEDWENLWQELKKVVTFWIDQGITTFRVDNPHTKSFYFWEWLITEVKNSHPEIIFLAEAFTRPNVMYQLAQVGFSQSYTYFTWRNTKEELIDYLTELTRSDVHEYFRPNFWPNTPDILSEYLQTGGRPAFMTRLVLAATLGASYGIYGPAFELCEDSPREPGSEEYLNSEKYEIKNWNINRSDSLADFITRINNIRRNNLALHENNNLNFHSIDNERMICYTKNTDDLSNIILVVVNLDPDHKHSGWLELPLDYLGLDSKQPFQVHDLLSGARYLWSGSRNYVELDPQIVTAHIFQIRRRIRTEKEFDYYL